MKKLHLFQAFFQNDRMLLSFHLSLKPSLGEPLPHQPCLGNMHSLLSIVPSRRLRLSQLRHAAAETASASEMEQYLANYAYSQDMVDAAKARLMTASGKDEKTAAYGHFGRTPEKDGAFSWEKTDKTNVFSK